MFAQIINPIIIAMSLSTAAGVFLHDTRIDKMTATALSLPSLVTYADIDRVSSLKSDLHTHIERGSLAQAVHDLKAQHPRIQPRETHDRRHMMQKIAPKGHHAFDNYSLPIV